MRDNRTGISHIKQDPPAVATDTRSRSGTLSRTRDIDLVVLVLADGFRPDVLRALLASGDLPNLKRHIVAEGSLYDGVSVLPSVTDVAYLPMLTGQYPGSANMPGIRWVDKTRFASGGLFLNGHRSYVGASHLRFDGDLPDNLETLFELCHGSVAVRSDIHRGLSRGRNRFHGIAIPFMFLSHYLKRADFVDRIGAGSLSRALLSMEGNSPRFAFLPLLDVDTASHAHGPRHRRTIEAYRRIDAIVGALIELLRRIGIWDRTHFLISSDHGHTETTAHLDLSALLSELGYSVFEHPHVYRRWADAAVMISGNSFANVYVSSEDKWERPLVADELEGEHQRLLDAVCQRVEVEWAAYRHHNGAVKVVSRSGLAVLDREGESYNYRYEGSDPLQLGLSRTTVRESEALDMTFETRFPDALEQLWYLFTSQRTGDIVITSKPGYDLRGWREWPEHHSSHGALCREHMRVPILSNRPLSWDGPVRTVDLFRTVIESLDLTATKPHFGHSLW